ncbi:PEP/pyruvate-binding domain-containing protein, partial [Endozoicomonas sp. SESOKO2]
GDAQAGKYLSEVQGEEDVLRTCLKVMASGYRPEVCPEGIPQPMALIIQQCIDCRYGGVAASFQSFQDDTLRVEYGPGQPRGVVAGQSGNTAHRIDIARIEGADIWEYFPGMFSSHFILRKNADNNGYLEKRIHDADVPSDGDGQRLSDDTVSELKEMVIKLENLLFCPVDVEFAIDRQGCPFVLQVRPVTRLSGGMDFAMPVPEDSLASGEAVSEGYCTGSIWLAKEQDAVAMPDGAIVVAHHAEEWMLVPEFLKRAGGFIIAEGGFNDHVAILMRQEKTPLMLAGGEYETVVAQDGQQATLACARFNSKSGAFVVAGDITEKLASHRSLSSAVSDVPLAKAVPSRDDLSPPEGTFCEVASGFQWLTDQNARLLA